MIRHFDLKLFGHRLFMIVVILIMFKPTYFDLNAFDDLFNGIAIIFFVLYAFKYLKSGKYSLIFILFMITRIIVLMSTYRASGDARGWIKNIIYLSLTFMFIESEGVKNIKDLLLSLYCALSIYTIINLISIMLFPEGLPGYMRFYFWGFKSELGKYMIVYLVVTFLWCLYFGKSIGWAIIGIILSMITCYLTNTSTGIMGILIFVLAFILSLRFQMLTNVYIYYIVAGCIFISATVINNMGFFSSFIETVLHRSATSFTGRTIIWKNAIAQINRFPLFGVGQLQYERMWQTLGGNVNYSDCHSFYLNLAFYGGFVSVALFIIMLFIVAKNINMYRSNIAFLICNAGILAYLVVFVFEGSSKPSFWVVLLLANVLGKNNYFVDKTRSHLIKLKTYKVRIRKRVAHG